MSWFVKCLQNYVTFSGRARRKEYWMFVLFNIVFGIVLQLVDGVLASVVGIAGLYLLYSLAVLLPGISVTVRRLHDIDKSGWWVWIALVPVVGVIVLIVFACLEGTKGPNRFGPDPKAQPAS